MDSKQHWFETWFDTPLYEALYAHRDYAEAKKLADLIAKHYPSQQYNELIDIACGRGRHSFNLAQLGYSVTGVDLSENAIRKAGRIAAEKFPELPLSFRTHDMREKLPAQWPLVVNLFTSFGYMTQDEANSAILKNMCDAVAHAGALVIDYLNSACVCNGLISSEEKQLESYDLHISRRIENNIVIKNMHFRNRETGVVQEFAEQVKLYGLSWFEDELAGFGLRVSRVYGTYDGQPYDVSNEALPRMIILAEKNQ
ncbi:MAG: class I SAM-dependent methyltransferase [Balneolales bacterium]|nr:class I SAM-dependent methyltransferase [Balneolales bacterium]